MGFLGKMVAKAVVKKLKLQPYTAWSATWKYTLC